MSVDYPAERCYWALISDPPVEARAWPWAFEASLPCSVEDLHAVFLRIPQGLLACGVATGDLQGWLAEHGEQALKQHWALHPAALPEHLRAQGLSDGLRRRLNLLSGPFVAPGRRRLATVVAVSMAALVVLALLAVELGTARRLALLEAATQEQRNLSLRLTRELLGLAANVDLIAVEETFRSAQRRLSQEGGERLAADLVPVFDALVDAWPVDLACEVARIDCGQERLSVRVLVGSEADRQLLLAALQHLQTPGGLWRSTAPRQARVGEHWSLDLSLRRVEGGG